LRYPAPTQTKLELGKVENEFLPALFTPAAIYDDLAQFTNYQIYVDYARFDPSWKDAEWNGFKLPAQGTAKEYCGKWVSWGCNNILAHPKNMHYCEHQVKTCKTAPCPICVESWINRQANRSTRRAMKFLENKQYSFRHVVLSPPSEVKSMSYNGLNRWLRKVMKIANIKTAMIVFHPFRFANKSKKINPYVSPHFHLLVYDKLLNTTEFYNKTKWLIKNKGDLETEVDIFNCVRYMLSHAGIKSKTHTIRYTGEISYRKLKVEKEPGKHRCPYCDLPLRIFFIKNIENHKPPPIDFVGLWDAKCFSPVDTITDDTKIPFYSLKEDSTDYEEHLIYSFEELFSVNINSPVIVDEIRKLRELKHKTSIKCKKLEDFIVN